MMVIEMILKQINFQCRSGFVFHAEPSAFEITCRQPILNRNNLLLKIF